jgi:hypothetical protein
MHPEIVSNDSLEFYAVAAVLRVEREPFRVRCLSVKSVRKPILDVGINASLGYVDNVVSPWRNWALILSIREVWIVYRNTRAGEDSIGRWTAIRSAIIAGQDGRRLAI